MARTKTAPPPAPEVVEALVGLVVAGRGAIPAGTKLRADAGVVRDHPLHFVPVDADVEERRVAVHRLRASKPLRTPEQHAAADRVAQARRHRRWRIKAALKAGDLEALGIDEAALELAVRPVDGRPQIGVFHNPALTHVIWPAKPGDFDYTGP